MMGDTLKKDIRQLDLDQLTDMLVGMGEKKFRAKQIYEWLWQKSARTFEEMTNLRMASSFLMKMPDHFNGNSLEMLASVIIFGRLCLSVPSGFRTISNA